MSAKESDRSFPSFASLRHYGQSFAESEPRGATKRRIMLRAFNVMRRQLGLITVLRVFWRSRVLARRVDRRLLAAIRQRGLKDQAFLAARIEEMALAAALVERLGFDRATVIYRQVLEAVADDVMHELVPTVEELNAFDDPFAAFRAYLEAVLDANARDGIHAAELRERTADAFAYDVTYCAYERVAAAFGDPRLCCISSCAGDEVSFPRLCHGIGARFVRQSTLAAGARCCDFRFERSTDSNRSGPKA
jgi:hypothetical protein